MAEHKFLTRLEAADLLRVSDQTVSQRVREGELAAVRVGRRVLVLRESLDAYLARCRVEARDAQRPKGTTNAAT